VVFAGKEPLKALVKVGKAEAWLLRDVSKPTSPEYALKIRGTGID